MGNPAILRSNIEFAKRVFLDRLTVDAPPLLQPDPGNIDEGPGVDYDYGGTWDPYDFGIGGDCSGISGIAVGATLQGPTQMSWGRLFSTETFPGPFSGFKQTNAQDLLNNPYPIKVWIEHGGGGPNSHMMCMIDGWQMESNGDYGTCTAGHGGTSITSSIWNDWWVYDAPINEDTQYRTPTQYQRGLDYAGGTVAGSVLKANDIQFVMRYLTPGGTTLPGKQLQAAEFQDLMNNGILVGFNFETTGNFMLSDEGAGDATQALNYIRSMPGIPANAQPTVYFSADFDEAQAQDQQIFNFLNSAATVLGKDQTRLYGDYYICKRAMDAGVIGGFWQTEAWSSSQDGYHIDSRVGIVQRNNAGYQTLNGVQCDINEAHQDLGDLGLWGTQTAVPSPIVPNPPSPTDPFIAWYTTASDSQLLQYIVAQLGPGDPSWASKGQTVRDYLWTYKPLWDKQLGTSSQPVLQVPVPKPIFPKGSK